MPQIEDVVDMTVALGKGVYSVGEDLVLGIQRTGEGLGAGENGRIAAIGYENRAMYGLMEKVLKYGLSDQQSPIYKVIVFTLENYYSHFPEEALTKLSKQAGLGVAYAVGRMGIGTQLAKYVAVRIAMKIAASTTYKQLSKRLGTSLVFSASGVGLPIGMLMMQGLLQRSSHGAMRLRSKSPQLYTTLQRNGDLHMIYFLIEKPLEQHMNALFIANRNIGGFQKAIEKKYQLTTPPK